MPAHGHGMNYRPEISMVASDESVSIYKVQGLVFHMPGTWQWDLDLVFETQTLKLQDDVVVD